MLRPLNFAAANALGASAFATNFAIEDNLNALQVRLEGSAGNARDLTANAAQVLGLTTARYLIAENRLLSTKIALHSHRQYLDLLNRSY